MRRAERAGQERRRPNRLEPGDRRPRGAAADKDGSARERVLPCAHGWDVRVTSLAQRAICSAGLPRARHCPNCVGSVLVEGWLSPRHAIRGLFAMGA